MRLWSLHPKYLDRQGLLGLWRETLLAKKVLEGKTDGYKRHPQLERFKRQKDSLSCINFYLHEVQKDGAKRGYNLDETKIGFIHKINKIKVHSKQVEYEFKHLMKKLQKRDKEKYIKLLKMKKIEVHHLFVLVEGEIETWEKLESLKES